MSDKKDKEFVCKYKYCLHHGEKVKESESVVVNKQHYHWDCAEIKQEILDIANTYISYVSDKSQYPIACRAITQMVNKDKIPIDYVKRMVETQKSYYHEKPAISLYGIRRLFFEKEFPA